MRRGGPGAAVAARAGRDGRQLAGLAVVRQSLAWTFMVLLWLAPALFGANVPLAWGLNAAGFGCLALGLLAAHVIWQRPLPVPFERLAPVVACLVVVLGWAWLQAQSFVPEALHHPAWAAAGEALGARLSGAISVNPSETTLAALRLATAAAVFLLAVQLGRDAQWSRRLVTALAVVPALWVVVALAARAAKVSLYPYAPAARAVAHEGQLTGPFINQNHFAIFLAIGMVAAWALVLDALGRQPVDRGLGTVRARAARMIHVALLLGTYSVLLLPLLGGILLTGSRAGLALAGVGVLVVSALVLLQRDLSPDRRRAVLGALGLAALCGLLALAAYGSRVSREIDASSSAVDLAPRLAVVNLALGAVAERPLLGHGFGTFADVFPSHRDDSLDIAGRWEEAHNAYVEVVLGLGIPVGVLLILTLAWLAACCVRGALVRRRDRLAPTAAAGAAVVVGLHALIDFSIQIQGVALLFATALGTGYAQCWSSRDAGPRPTAQR